MLTQRPATNTTLRDVTAEPVPINVEEETRFSVVLYGGVSLAIYISGVCMELLDLVRATAASHAHDNRSAMAVYRAVASLSSTDLAHGPEGLSWAELAAMDRDELVDELAGRGVRRKMVVDVLSGSSAGGLNALYLSKALINDLDMDPVRKVWVERAGLESLLNDEKARRKRPDGEEEIAPAEPPPEHPPSALDGDWFYRVLLNALDEMVVPEGEAERATLVEALDAYITTTDLRGIRHEMALADGRRIEELLHRVVAHLGYGTEHNDFDDVGNPFLAFLGRATAAHPAAFEPAQLEKVAALVAGAADAHDDCDAKHCRRAGEAPNLCPKDGRWPRILTPHDPDRGVADRWYSDGGAMDNKPFGYALRPVGQRRAHQPVDRKVVYVEPSPGVIDEKWQDSTEPKLAEYVGTAFNLGRTEPIRQDLEEIAARNLRIDGIRNSLVDIVEGLPAPDAKAWRVYRQDSVTDQKQHRWEETEQWIEQAESTGDGSPLPAYERRRYHQVVSQLAEVAVRHAGLVPGSPGASIVEHATTRHFQDRYLDPARPNPSAVNHRRFLVDFDLSYRLRRLGMVDQLLSETQRRLAVGDRNGGDDSAELGQILLDGKPVDPGELADRIVACRQDLNRSFVELRTMGRRLRGSHPDPHEDLVAAAAGTSFEALHADLDGMDPSQPIDIAKQSQHLKLDGFFDYLQHQSAKTLHATSVQSRHAITRLGGKLGEHIEACWQHYPKFDGLLMTTWQDTQGEIDPVEVVRISPLDAPSIITPRSERHKIGGDAVHHFGGFFDERWRAVDLLWGRLDAAEILVRTLMPVPPERPTGSPGDAAALDAERAHRLTIQEKLIEAAQLRILETERGHGVAKLTEISASRPGRSAPDLSDADPATVLDYLRTDFDVDLSLAADRRRQQTKSEVVRRVADLAGRVVASQPRNDVGRPTKSAKAVKAAGRALHAVVDIASPTGPPARIVRLSLGLATLVGLLGVASPVVTSVWNRAGGTMGSWLAAGGIAALCAGGVALRRRGDNPWGLGAGIAMLAGSAVLTTSALSPMVQDHRVAAAVGAIHFLLSIVWGVLIAVGGTVKSRPTASRIGVGVFVVGIGIAAGAAYRWWPMVVLVVGSAVLAVLTGALSYVTGRLGDQLGAFGEPEPRGKPYPHFTVAAAKTVANTTAYLVTGRKSLLLEGKLKRGVYRNWSGDRRHQANWHQPLTETEVAELVAGANTVRVVGSGHSFNDGLTTDDITLSLDRLSGVVAIDEEAARATVWGGTRLRDLTPKLLERGLALRSLASHDAQSIAGILATDVHGTGRKPAHLSDQVVSLRLVDGTGTIHEVGPDDDLFKAAIGGLGSVGVITQVTVECVPAFKLAQRTMVKSRQWAENNLDRLLAEHDHVSFYAYPFTDLLHVHTWDHTTRRRSFLGAKREALNESKAAVAAAVVGDAMAHTGLLPKTAGVAMRLQRSTDLVLDAHQAFSRTQYHLHQELEVAVPRHRVWDDLDQTLTIYRDLYREQRLPFLLVEVRFSPAGHDRSLLGPGADRDSAWLCLCANQSGAVHRYFGEIERWVRTADARIHLGKWCEELHATDVAAMHGPRFERFQQIRATADPDGRFLNRFAKRVLGPIAGTR